ncbi:hypothetical protein B5D77_07780 [Microcystis sp. MC19]|nr:hypothetical protein B5D77_07780 [Microcystis sp. MC19]
MRYHFLVSPDEKIFTPTEERDFLPYTRHPTPYTLFPVRRQKARGKRQKSNFAKTENLLLWYIK